jgi:hypothetical protein
VASLDMCALSLRQFRHCSRFASMAACIHIERTVCTSPLHDPPSTSCIFVFPYGHAEDLATFRSIIVLAATNRLHDVDMALRRPGRFDREIEVAAPSPAARQSMLAATLSSMSHSVTEAQVHEVAALLHGFVAADVVGLCQEAAMAVLRRHVASRRDATSGKKAHGACQHAAQMSDLVVHVEDLRAAAAVVKPSGMREVTVEVPKVVPITATVTHLHLYYTRCLHVLLTACLVVEPGLVAPPWDP